MPWFDRLNTSLQTFTPIERRDMFLYIIGIMTLKFGSEAFVRSVVSLATSCFDMSGSGDTFEKLGLLQGLNLGMRCFGSIVVGPLIRKFSSRDVLSGACALLGISIGTLLILDAAKGGRFKTEVDEERGLEHYGTFNPVAMVPIYAVCGLSNGIMDLARSVIPRDMVGGNVDKLQKLDSVVHIFLALSAIAGSITTGLVFIPRLGNNRSFMVTPLCCGISAFLFYHMSNLGFQPIKDHDHAKHPKPFRAITAVGRAFWLFGENFYVGARILFSSRNFIWLIPGYGLGSYAHRYLDTCVVPQLAKRVLGHPSYSLVIISGSSIGEFLGSLFIFFWTNQFRTPIFWLRIDAIFLLLVWFFPFWVPAEQTLIKGLPVLALLIPVSFAWAANDVSISAYVQAALTRLESTSPRISSLSALLCFMYCLQIGIYASLGSILGNYLDNREPGEAIHKRLVWTVGAQFTAISIMIMVSTFIPMGSRAWNPKIIGERQLDTEVSQSEMGETVGMASQRTSTVAERETETGLDLEASNEPQIEPRSIRRTFRNFIPIS